MARIPVDRQLGRLLLCGTANWIVSITHTCIYIVTHLHRGFVRSSYTEAPGCPIDVADPVGAGDAFAAVFVHGLAANWSAEDTARFANRVGAVVASARGAIPEVVAGTCCADDEPACPSRDRRAHDSHGGS